MMIQILVAFISLIFGFGLGWWTRSIAGWLRRRETATEEEIVLEPFDEVAYLRCPVEDDLKIEFADDLEDELVLNDQDKFVLNDDDLYGK